MHGVTKSVREVVARWRLWRAGEPLFVAVSGGVDSMVLLDLVRRLPAGVRPKPTVLHFNHKIRIPDSDKEAAFVQEACRRWNLPVVVGESGAWASKQNLQARARERRYRFFEKEAERLGFSKIATAHHADDQAETFLIRWIQGAGLKGLAGIPMVRKGGVALEIIRPFLFVARAEILDYAKRFEVPFCEDASNQDSRYLRNQVRKILRSFGGMNPRLARRASINSVFLKADEEFLEAETEKIFRMQFPVAVYLSLPPALRYRILQRMFEAAAGREKPLGGDHILKIDSLLQARAPRSRYNLPEGILFVKDYVTFCLRG